MISEPSELFLSQVHNIRQSYVLKTVFERWYPTLLMIQAKTPSLSYGDISRDSV